ncbi:DUF4145 domain-containing protein [Bacillus sp. FJAT-50079]|uniref:DUF4145 domain-containing protein n=1 Tax=Bacillus sp. FJAT-50079 TaxID=2833577 RepID=UPI001BCA45F3|nr:DUF4145 domain-containing protein [Bacillus sp. FJAT-50079]MBS4207459.1 DUF4145 domain-containing protein [Bacillus sp. FJAT-50079]
MKKEAIPSLKENKYNCPYCHTYCPQYHYTLERILYKENIPRIDTYDYGARRGFIKVDSIESETKNNENEYSSTACPECDGISFWHNDKMVYPIVGSIPKPLADMPSGVKSLYTEASDVFNISPRSSSALLRLAIELLLEHLGEKGDLNDKIKSIVKLGVSTKIQQGLDAVRWYGNNSVHPSSINLDERREDVIYLFDLLNIIVQELITDVKEAEKFYHRLPKGFIEHIAKRDKNKVNS